MRHLRNKAKLGLGLALTAALVCSLVLIAAPPMAASPGVIRNAPVHFGAGKANGGGDVMWSLEKTHTLANDRSIYLYGPDAGNYAMFHLFPTVPMTIQDLSTFKFWVYSAADVADYQMTIDFVADVDGDGHRTFPPDYAIGSSAMSFGPLTTGWHELTALDLLAATPIEGGWYYEDEDGFSVTSTFTDLQGWLTAGTIPAAAWQPGGDHVTNGDGTENFLRIQLGGAITTWGDDETWVDDVTVNTTTYDLEAFLIPSLGVDVKGSEQKFIINGYINVGPIFADVDTDIASVTSAEDIDPVVDNSWTVTPGVNSPVVTVEAGGNPGGSYITISAVKPGDCVVKVKLDDEDEDSLPDMTLSAEKKWGEINNTVLEASQITLIEAGDEVDLDETVYATIHWGSMDPEDEVVMAAGGADVHWWLVKDTPANQAELEAILVQIFGADNVSIDGMFGAACGQYAEADDPFTKLDHFYTTDADPVTALKTYFSKTEGDATSGKPTYVSTVTDDSLPPALCRDVERGWTQASVEFLDTLDGPFEATDDVIVIALATYPVNLHGENPVCVEFQKLTSLPPEDLKDVQTYVDDVLTAEGTVDPIRKMLYVFVRDYDGSPAAGESVEFVIDGPFGLFEALLTDTNIDSAVSCYDADAYPAGIFAASKAAVSTTRLANTAEIAKFGDFVDLVYEATDTTGYAIAGVKIVSSHCEDVDVLIYVHDCYGQEEVVITRDVMVTGFCEVLPPDILAYYRGLGEDPNVVETTDLLQAANDWANEVVPSGFTEPISTTQLLALANEWAATD